MPSALEIFLEYATLYLFTCLFTTQQAVREIHNKSPTRYNFLQPRFCAIFVTSRQPSRLRFGRFLVDAVRCTNLPTYLLPQLLYSKSTSSSITSSRKIESQQQIYSIHLDMSRDAVQLVVLLIFVDDLLSSADPQRVETA